MSQLRLDGSQDEPEPPTLRDLKREREFLLNVAHGRTEFAEHVEQRLAMGDKTFGDSWAWTGVRVLLRELLEEAADIAAWGVLCLQALDRDRSLSSLHREQLAAVLENSVRHGARAHEALSIALQSVEKR